MQIIERTPSWGSSLGTALGQGLSEGIGQIANIKLQKMLEKQQYKQQQERGQEIWEGLGFPSNVAKALGSMGQQAQQKALTTYSPFVMSNLQKQSGQQQQGLEQILSGQQPQVQTSQQRMPSQEPQQTPTNIPSKQQVTQQQSQLAVPVTQPVTPPIETQQPVAQQQEQLVTQEPIKTKEQQKNEIIARKQQEKEEKSRQIEERKTKKADDKEVKEKEALKKAETPLAEKPEKQLKTQIKETKKLSKSPAFKNLPTPKVKKEFAKEIKAREKEIKKEQKLLGKKEPSVAEQKRIEANNKKTRESLEDLAILYPETTNRVKEQIELVNSGKMSWPLWKAAIDTAKEGVHGMLLKFGGIDLSSLTSHATQKFDKLRAENIGQAKAVIGSKMAVEEFNAFMEQYAKSTHSDESKVELLNNQLKRLDAGKIRYDNMIEILKENNNKEPKYLTQLIEQRSAKQLQQLEEDYKSGKKGIPYTPKSWKNALVPEMIQEASEKLPPVGGEELNFTGPIKDIKGLLGFK